MRRFTLAVAVLALGVPATLAVSGSAAVAKRTTHHFSLTFLGAQPAADEAVYDVFGTSHGAAVQKIKYNAAGTGGTSKTRYYDGHGAAVTTETFTISPPDAAGLLTITGSGHYLSGIGRYRHITGTFTFSGTFNSTNGALKVKAVGTQRY